MEHDLVKHTGIMMTYYRNTCLLGSRTYVKEFLLFVRRNKI